MGKKNIEIWPLGTPFADLDYAWGGMSGGYRGYCVCKLGSNRPPGWMVASKTCFSLLSIIVYYSLNVH